jgi:hypothetical protein
MNWKAAIIISAGIVISTVAHASLSNEQEQGDAYTVIPISSTDGVTKAWLLNQRTGEMQTCITAISAQLSFGRCTPLPFDTGNSN